MFPEESQMRRPNIPQGGDVNAYFYAIAKKSSNAFLLHSHRGKTINDRMDYMPAREVSYQSKSTGEEDKWPVYHHRPFHKPLLKGGVSRSGNITPV